MNQEIILFGCGNVGYEALELLGKENIRCFCDNNPCLAGTEKYGKIIIPFEKLKSEDSNAIIIICVADDRIAYEIAAQCEEGGIWDYLLFKSIKALALERTELLDFIENPDNRMQMRQEAYRARINELQEQVDYFKRNADIRYMKPATGGLRSRQLVLVKGSAEFLEKISELEIKPFLYGGNLLGYVRHNGFIPWDDDIDFALMRNEYERLKEYCRNHIYTTYEYYDDAKKAAKQNCIPEDMRDYYWRDGADLITIYKPLERGGRIRIDFFVLDYYADEYAFDSLMSYAGEVYKKMIPDWSVESRMECLKAALLENQQNIASESNHIYFGIDNTEIRHKYHRGQWIPKDVVFPLKRVLYEGEYFWIPNDPEEFVKYEYENIWDFPDDVGIFRHAGMDYD